MSRPRKPTATLESTGAFIKHPERKRERAAEPKPTGELGEPPASLERDAKAIWRELFATLPPSVAGNCDRSAFEELVRLKAGARKGRLSAAEQGLLLSYHAKFGMTPSDRSKVKLIDDQAQDPLESFLSRKPATQVAQ